MRFVLDASVSLPWVLPGSWSLKARQLRAGYQKQLHVLLAPDIFIGENANALIKAERQKMISIGQAAIQHADIMSTSPVLVSFRPFVALALEIASLSKAGFYDCLYVSLAEHE